MSAESDLQEFLQDYARLDGGDAHAYAKRFLNTHARELAETSHPLEPVTVPEGDVPGFHDPVALHALVVKGLRSIGLSDADAAKYAAAHQQDALDRAAGAIDDEAWPHEKPEHENQTLYRLADKVRTLPLRDICDCGREKQPGENHSLCYPGME